MLDLDLLDKQIGNNGAAGLWEYLEYHLEDSPCNHTLDRVRFFLQRYPDCDKAQVIKLLTENGGYCDCEVLENIFVASC
jgi:hypothetical protein